ncbi:MAG: cob(I)yrinic acid a,c-diamide adenosyltransferase [Gammaproteobacteria bacterium]|nr:cob(I)yrinic acid a,c-diamide adenosyltransferase [Gammaproteobacteria bacterium]
MGNRLSKLYTRTGDDGTSGLSDGSRIPKDHARMQAMGSVDELNSVVGLMINKLSGTELATFFTAVQHDLFNIGGELSMPGHSFINAEKVSALEAQIDAFNAEVSPLKDFILPGGSEAASICHIARATARRAERDVVTLHQIEVVSETTRQYLNRLSDLLFVTARIINKNQGEPDILWKKELS